MKEHIENKLNRFLMPEVLSVEDVSHLHRGHFEGAGEETHFVITIKSSKLDTLSLVKKHRAIQEILAEEFKIVHSISIKIA